MLEVMNRDDAFSIGGLLPQRNEHLGAFEDGLIRLKALESRHRRDIIVCAIRALAVAISALSAAVVALLRSGAA